MDLSPLCYVSSIKVTMYGLHTGTKIAQFTLDQQLGQGGQGSVWRAHATEGSGAPVALKVIPVRGTPTTMVERVRREAEALMRLSQNQPSVVTCLGVHEDPQLGVLAVAMEMVDGVELQQALRNPRCDAAARETILLHVARALGHLHDNGFVHRDIKPQNILVKHTFFDQPHDPSSVKLVDFGIATPKGNPKPLTEVGTVIGTPAYMPPERIDPIFWQAAMGLPCEDVFALGVVAYEALFGRHPSGVEDDGTLSIFAERYRAVSRSGEPWPQLPPDHRWSPALRGALALRVADRLADGNAFARVVTQGPSAADVSRQPPRTEIGLPVHGLGASGFAQDGFAPKGQTQAGPVAAAASTSPMSGNTGWGAPPPQASYPSIPAIAPSVPAIPPPPVQMSHHAGGSSGGSGAIKALMVIVGVLAIGVPAVVLAARFVGSRDSDDHPIAPIEAPPPTITTATAAPTDTAPPALPTFPTAPAVDTSTAPPPVYTSTKPPSTATTKPPSTATGYPTTTPTTTTAPTATVIPTATSTGNGTAPPIGGKPPATSDQPGGRPPPIRIGIPTAVPTGTPTTPPTSNPGTGRPSGPIRIGGKK